MIKAQAISGFYENLPEAQILEDSYKEIIRKNYNLSGFVSLDTPAVERLEVLTSKGADDNEIYALKRIHAEDGDKSNMGLRFDLTVPLARYIGQYEGELNFPFKRQQIARVYRGERPQKGRYREFYQADIDIIGNSKLPLFADVEIISTISNTLKELNFGDFIININNKKFLGGFLDSIGIASDKIVSTIRIIDKKEKISKEKLKDIYLENGLDDEQIKKIDEFIEYGNNNNSKTILKKFLNTDNKLLKEGIEELNYLYENLLDLGVDEKYLNINPSISRGLDYYTGTVFETFISGAESMGSISSGGRYENLASNFTKTNFPGVGGSIGLSRLLAVLKELGKIKLKSKTITKILVLNTGNDFIKQNLKLVNSLRNKGINTELYLDGTVKLQKQLKYANNKNIPFVVIQADDEIKKGVVQLKDLNKGEQTEVLENDIINLLN